MRRRLMTLTLSGALAAGPAWGDPPDWSSFQIHGFADQAAVRTSANRWFGDSPDTSFDFTELGLNASLKLYPRLLLAAQLLARRAGEMYDGTPAVDYALADIDLVSSEQGRSGLRLGRYKNPLGLYNETRDVPFTHPGIFLPQTVYYDKVRNLALASDGGLMYGDLYRDFGTLSASLGYGTPVIDENVEWAYLGADFDGEVEPDGRSWLAAFWYTDRSERLKLGWSSASLSTRFVPERGATLALEPGTTDIFYWIASVQYSAEDWTLVAEYAREPLAWSGYGPYFPDRKGEGEGYYVQGTYRPLAPVELMLRFEEGFADRADPTGRAAAIASGGRMDPTSAFSRIWSAGIRWDINRHWMARVEYGRHRGAFVLSPRENPDPGDLAEHWDMWAAQLVFRF